MENKFCLNCQGIVRGRTDKKFCDDLCRSQYYNRLNSVEHQHVRKINNVLMKNRKILSSLLYETRGPMTLEQLSLAERGFQFRYHTHSEKQEGSCVYYCYEYGYREIDPGKYLLFTRVD